MDETRGTFLVTHADGDSAVLRDVAGGRVHTLSSNPGVEVEDVLDATLAPEPPTNVTWQVVEVHDRSAVAVERVDEPPSEQAVGLAPADVGDLATADRDDGELHVLRVAEDGTDSAASDVTGDEATVSRAARLGASRVEVRAADGVVSVRYRE
jgi:hypothetical protein